MACPSSMASERKPPELTPSTTFDNISSGTGAHHLSRDRCWAGTDLVGSYVEEPFGPPHQQHRVILPDDSPGRVEPFTADGVCADILAIADAAGVERFAWYGFSWGAVVGL